MALWAIGDMHLSFSVDKPMDHFGSAWKHHEKKIQKHFRKQIWPEDTVVITGDHSWGRNLLECEKDLAFIEALPGRKILLRGNHDMFWKVSKTEKLNEKYKDRLYFLQNNFFAYHEYALVGTKGYCYEGKDTLEHFEKIRNREIDRLQKSFQAAEEAGYKKFLMFLHYPPTSIGEQESPFTKMAEYYRVDHVVYSHCHGQARFDDSFKGFVNGIGYHLVSGDYLHFKPHLLIEDDWS